MPVKTSFCSILSSVFSCLTKTSCATGFGEAIVEAMKLMNEIESEFDGVVTKILVENEQTVEYGQPLFEVE